MLHINPTKLDEAVINRAPGWSLDLANSKVDDANHQLRLSFTSSTQLQDAIGPLATIVFLVTLPKQDTLTDVVLSSSKFYTSANVELPQCANISNADSNFTLLLRCGDATLQGFMQTGKIGMRIDPIHPNPVDAAANGVIIFRYATRFEGNVTISIVDELGVEVAHPVSNMWLPAGEYLMRYKTSSLPSGSYIVRGSLDGVSVSRRFVVKK
jgi:hypothetical protein